jgi:antigen flippase
MMRPSACGIFATCNSFVEGRPDELKRLGACLAAGSADSGHPNPASKRASACYESRVLEGSSETANATGSPSSAQTDLPARHQPSPQPPPQPLTTTQAPTSSYGQILKSTSLIGGAQALGLVLGMVRTKGAALLIGPSGIGLLGTFATIQALVGSVAGLGIPSSAVRDVAQAVASGDEQAVARTVTALRRVSWLTGLAGALALVALAVPLSRWTFETDAHAAELMLLGAAIFLGNVSAGQAALIQGLRRIGDLARLNIIGAAAGTVISLGAYLWLGVRGVAPSLVLMAAVQLAASWHYARRAPLAKVRVAWAESLRAAGGMARLGLVFMWTGLLANAVAYATRVLIAKQLDLAAVGIYGAAFSLSGMFVNFVLGAMGSDFYPRLTAAAPNSKELNRLVNEQTEIGILLALPGLLATLCLAPWVVRIFYSAEFAPAVGLLQWFVLGCLGRVLSWPLGFLMLALGKGRWFNLTETSANVLHLGLVWGGLAVLGLEGVAVAFALLYVCYTAAVYLVGRRLTGFQWSRGSWRLGGAVPMLGVVFLLPRVMPVGLATGLGVVVTVVTGGLCVRGLMRRLGAEHRVVRWLSRLWPLA